MTLCSEEDVSSRGRQPLMSTSKRGWKRSKALKRQEGQAVFATRWPAATPDRLTTAPPVPRGRVAVRPSPVIRSQVRDANCRLQDADVGGTDAAKARPSFQSVASTPRRAVDPQLAGLG
jgi:hypothetical protein